MDGRMIRMTETTDPITATGIGIETVILSVNVSGTEHDETMETLANTQSAVSGRESEIVWIVLSMPSPHFGRERKISITRESGREAAARNMSVANVRESVSGMRISWTGGVGTCCAKRRKTRV